MKTFNASDPVAQRLRFPLWSLLTVHLCVFNVFLDKMSLFMLCNTEWWDLSGFNSHIEVFYQLILTVLQMYQKMFEVECSWRSRCVYWGNYSSQCSVLTPPLITGGEAFWKGQSLRFYVLLMYFYISLQQMFCPVNKSSNYTVRKATSTSFLRIK